MDVPYRVIRHIGEGATALVFLVEFNGVEAALKARFGCEGQKEMLISDSKEEYSNLSRVSGIKGIPHAIEFFDGLHGSYEKLILAACGNDFNEVAWEGNYTRYFEGLFLMEYIKNGKKLSCFNKQGSDFFDSLEHIADKVHGRGHHLPSDFDIIEAGNLIESGNEPYILDWAGGGELSEYPQAIKEDQEAIQWLRECYQINYLAFPIRKGINGLIPERT